MIESYAETNIFSDHDIQKYMVARLLAAFDKMKEPQDG